MTKFLQVKEIQGPHGPQNVLADQDGDVLPGQVAVTVSDTVSGARMVTVAFRILPPK